MNSIDATKAFPLNLKKGELGPEDIRYVTFKTIVKYPYKFIGQANRQKVKCCDALRLLYTRP